MRPLVSRCLAPALILLLAIAACANPIVEPEARAPIAITLTVDGESRTIETQATTVRELLSEAGVFLNPADEIQPPLFTPLTEPTDVTVVRVTESIELIERGVPFDRQIVRNEAMSAEDAPVIIQPGQPGVQEVTVRIVYRDGLEAERLETQAVLIEEPQDEIVMVGLGAAPGGVQFAGVLAYISSGSSIILRGASDVAETLNTGGELDRRVFALSPAGDYLLYTRATTDTTRFNSLWVIGTQRGAQPRSLGVDNVLWAAWNPASETPELAYTTGKAIEALPGWEANNDLWRAILPDGDGDLTEEAEQLVEAYPATYGWWGGNYAWSPDGRWLAYSYADEVGVLDLALAVEAEDAAVARRRRLQQFREYNTRASWVWVPTISWSPDSRYIAFTNHGGEDADALVFDTWVVDVSGAITARFVRQAGIWGHPHWSTAVPGGDPALSRIAFLRATNPLDSLRSSYTLWLMDQDGSNAYQLHPPRGENSRFPRESQFMAWGPSGQDLAFVFDEDLYLHSLASAQTFRLTQDDNTVSHPTWAPYGAAVPASVAPTRLGPIQPGDEAP